MKLSTFKYQVASLAMAFGASIAFAEDYVITSVDAEMPVVTQGDGLTINLPNESDVYAVAGNRADTWWGVVDIFNGRLVCTNSAALSMCTIVNRNSDQLNTLEISQQEDDAYGAMRIRGPLNVVKSGPASLTIIDREVTIEGTLDVAEGALCLAGPMLAIAGDVVVRAGATLDLGGRVRRCNSFVLDGGTVRNGTLIAALTEIRGGTVEAMLSGKDILKTGEGEALLAQNPKPTASTLLNGLVCCYHFDDGETLFDDASPNGYTLANCYTNDAMKVEPSSVVTCDTDTHAYAAGGSAYFDGNVFLHLRDSVWPDKASSGEGNPYSYAFWVRVDAEDLNGRGLYFFGTANDEGANAMIFERPDCLWSYFWSSSEWDYYLPDGEGRVDLTGAWHSVVQTWDGGVYRCFIDGVEATYAVHEWRSDVRTKAWGGNLGHVIFNIGAGHNAWPMIGWLDEFAVWNRALTLAEIADYNAAGVPTEGGDVEPLVSVDEGALKVLGGASGSITDGIVMCYRFDSEEGLLEDSGPNGYTLKKDYDWGNVSFSSVEKIDGNGAIYFDGSTTIVPELGWPAKMPSGNAPFSCALFFRCDGARTSNYDNFGLVAWGSTAGGYSCNANVLWSWQAQICNYTWGDQDCLLVPNTWEQYHYSDGWHSFVQTWDGERMHFYVDGAELPAVNAAGDGGLRTVTTPLNVGKDRFIIGNGFNNAWFVGWMDDVTVWDRALSSEEALMYCGGGLSGQAIDGCTVEVKPGAVLRSVSGTVEIAGGIATGGTIEGDLVLRDGARVIGSPGETTTVTGTLKIEGSGTLSPLEPLTVFPALFPMFHAEDGLTDGSAEMAKIWQFDDPPDNARVKFSAGADLFRCTVSKLGFTLIVR